MKSVLLLTPLLVVIYQQVARVANWPRLSIAETLVGAIFIFVASVLSFQDNERGRMVRRIILAILFLGGMFVVIKFPGSPAAALLGVFSKTFSSMPVLGAVSGESWLYLVFIYISLVVVRSFTSRDALWLGRRGLLWWNGLFIMYVTVVTTFCVINSAVPLRVGTSWRIASDKSVLLRNPYQVVRTSWRNSQAAKWRVFSLALLSGNSAMAQTIHLLCEQRGFFRIGYRDAISRECSIEDVLALVFIALAFAVIVIFRL